MIFTGQVVNVGRRVPQISRWPWTSIWHQS